MTLPTPARTGPAHEALAARFGGARLPSGLREQAEAMPWSAFTATYSATSGPLRLGHWHCPDGRPPTSLGPQPQPFRATLALGDRIETATATATGPIAALTAMLYDRGVAVEMLRFHQLESDGHIATFVQGNDGRQSKWGMGCSQNRTESALRAVIASANRLLTT